MIHFGWNRIKYKPEGKYQPTIGFDKSIRLGTHHLLTGEIDSSKDIPDPLKSKVQLGDQFVFRADQLTGIDEPSYIELQVKRPTASPITVLTAKEGSQVPIEYAHMVADLLGRAKQTIADQLNDPKTLSFLDRASTAFQTGLEETEQS